jgi:uncharacterized protein (TIGR02453 family)
MKWFTEDAIDFLAELELNNDRSWFERNKKRYESSLKGPMEAFAGELIERMRASDPGIVMTPKESVFRIYRDTRFSKDKSPYKTNAGLVVSAGDKKDRSSIGVYFHLDARRMGIASGVYMAEPDRIAAIRAHIAANLDEFAGLLEDPTFKERFRAMTGEKNKIIPAELREAAAKQPLIYNKQFYYWAEHDAMEALREDLPEFVIAHAEAARPMNRFLDRSIA